MGVNLAAVFAHELCGGRVTYALPATANEDLGAEGQKTLGHRLAETGAAASYENPAPLKEIVSEQGVLRHGAVSKNRDTLAEGKISSASDFIATLENV
jgi:hypothetical protein